MFYVKAWSVIFVGYFISVNGRSEDAFEGDFLFWGLKNKTLNTHRTTAFYSRPLELNSGSARLGRNTLFVSPLNGVIWAMAADYHAKRIYYTDHVSNYIGVYDLKTKEHHRVFEGMSWGIDGLSVDWVSGNVYWIDSNVNWIMVADRNFTNYRNLVPINSFVVAKVAVDPNNRYLYWSEKRKSDCRIHRTDLNGRTAKTLIIIPEAQQILDMTVDSVNNRLYWSEIMKKVGGIGRVRYINMRTGDTPRVVYRARNAHFFGLASYKGHLYVMDDLQERLLVISKEEEQIVHEYKFSSREKPRGITVYSGYEHPMATEDENHGCKESTCEQLCLATHGHNQFTCECSIGFTLQRDGRSCRSEIITDSFAIILDGKHSKLFQMSLESAVLEPQNIQVSRVSRPSSVAYDWLTRTVYWSDEKARTISRASMLGKDQRVLVRNSTVTSIALDPLAGNMYWIDSEKDAMFVAKLDGSHTRTLHIEQLHIVWGMTIDPSRGYLYWSDWGQIAAAGVSISVIKSSKLDGSDVKTIGKPGDAPRGLALDPERNILFWSQIKTYSIEWVNLNDHTTGIYDMPFGKRESLLGLPMVTGIAYWQNYLYISDQGRNHILEVAVTDIINSNNRSSHEEQVRPFGSAILYQPAGIYAFDSALARTKGGSPICVNSNCPHLCIPVHAGDQVVAKCVCQDHFKYVSEDNNCVQESSTSDTTPPSFGSTCPESRQVVADECSEEAEVYFDEPTAIDDSNFHITLKQLTVIPQMPARLKEGRHVFAYSASDRSHNEVQCQFTIEVLVRTCFNILMEVDENRPYGAEVGDPSCGDRVGSVANVTCPGIPGVAYQYECQSNLIWTPLGPESCDPNMFTAPSETTTPTPVTSRPTEPTTPIPITSRPASPTSPADTTTRASETDKTSVGPTSTSSTFHPSTLSDGAYGGLSSAKKKSGINTGLIVGVVLSLLILLALAALIIILYRKRRKPFTPGTNWNRIEDRVQLTGASTESGIYLGESEQPLAHQNGKM